MENMIFPERTRQLIDGLYVGLKFSAYELLTEVQKTMGRSANVVQGMRSLGEQLSLYGQGRNLVNGKWKIYDPAKIVTNAKPGLSYHCYGLAFDVAWQGEDPYLRHLSESERNDVWAQYGELVRKNGFHWGGDFHLINGVIDYSHAELSFGLSISECQELWERGGLKAVWNKLDLIRRG